MFGIENTIDNSDYGYAYCLLLVALSQDTKKQRSILQGQDTIPLSVSKYQIPSFQPAPKKSHRAHAHKLLDCSHIHKQHSTAGLVLNFPLGGGDNQMKAPL